MCDVQHRILILFDGYSDIFLHIFSTFWLGCHLFPHRWHRSQCIFELPPFCEVTVGSSSSHDAPLRRSNGHLNQRTYTSNSHAHHFPLFTSRGCPSSPRSLKSLQPVPSIRAPPEKTVLCQTLTKFFVFVLLDWDMCQSFSATFQDVLWISAKHSLFFFEASFHRALLGASPHMFCHSSTSSFSSSDIATTSSSLFQCLHLNSLPVSLASLCSASLLFRLDLG